MSLLAQVVFSVRDDGGKIIIERIDSGNSSDIRFEDALARKTKSFLISKYKALLEQPDAASFTGELFGSLHIITPIYHTKTAVVFTAVKKAERVSECPSDDASFLKRCGESNDGVFFWHVEKEGFFLANADGLFNTAISNSAQNQAPEHIYGPKKAAFIRSRLVKCSRARTPVSFAYHSDAKHYAVTLFPFTREGLTAGIIGIGTDMTKLIHKIRYRERIRRSFSEGSFSNRQQAHFERFLALIAKDFLDSDLSGFDARLNHIVTMLAALLDADWVSAFKDESIVFHTCGHCFSRTPSAQAQMNGFISSGAFDLIMKQIRRGHIYAVNDVRNELPSLYAALADAGCPCVPAFAAVPVYGPDEFWGVLSVFSLDRERIWTTGEIQLLKSIADIIMSAYTHSKMEKHLAESNRVLAEYDECLQDMLSVQETLAVSAKRFLAAKPDDFPACTNAMLQSLCELTETDEASVSVFDEECRCFFSWRIKGLTFSPTTKGGLPIEAEEWHRLFRDTDMVAIDDIAEAKIGLPEPFYEATVKMGVKSLLIVPIRHESKVIAVLCVYKILGICRWNNALIQTAKQFSDVFLSAYIRNRNDSRLNTLSQLNLNHSKETLFQVNLLQKAAGCVRDLIDATEENLCQVFCSIFKHLAETLPIESANLTRYNDDYTKTSIVLHWHSTTPPIHLSDGMASSFNRTFFNVPVIYRDVVWGCLIVNSRSFISVESVNSTFEYIAESLVRTFMRIYPDHNNKKKTKTAKLALAPHPVTV